MGRSVLQFRTYRPESPDGLRLSQRGNALQPEILSFLQALGVAPKTLCIQGLSIEGSSFSWRRIPAD